MKKALGRQLLKIFLHLMTPSHLDTESVTVAQVKQYCEMDSHEEKLHNLVLQSKINETKGLMERKASEIDRSKSMGSGRVDTGFNSDTIISTSGCFGSGCPPASASAPPKGLGMKLGKTQRTNQFLESLKAEGEVIVEDVRTRIGQSSAAAPPTDPVTLTHEEKLNVTLKQDGGIGNFDLQGMLSLQILNQDDGHIQVQVETGGNPGIIFKIHPNINKDLFSGENILGFKDPNRSFSAAQAGDGLPLLKWRMQSADESLLPLSINCWPSVSGNETHVNLEYETPPIFDLQDVVISIPLPALREAPRVPVPQIDGDWSYNSRKSILEWSILLIDKSNRSGSMEFVIPAEIDASDLFPISVRFTSTSTFSGLKVVNVVPLKGGNAPKFSQRTLLSTDNYQVV
ncbi:hypothetical protein OROHE_019016 [Orobanche hederae]